MIDGIAMVELLLGLPGMRVLGVTEGDDELVVTVESTASTRRAVLRPGRRAGVTREVARSVLKILTGSKRSSRTPTSG
ncbi:MAG TPA: hypothetical protein VK390_09090 [Propionibacteriaceae bacterium]|nr:hypothetical protein [Propionibacteriaceae bacterium]